MGPDWTAVGRQLATRTDLVLTTLMLAGALLLAAVIIKLVDRWRKQQSEDACSAQDQLAHFQELHWKGELSKAEYDRIASLLEERIRQEHAPAPTGPPPSQPDGAPRPPQPPETGIRPQPPG